MQKLFEDVAINTETERADNENLESEHLELLDYDTDSQQQFPDYEDDKAPVKPPHLEFHILLKETIQNGYPKI